MLARDPNNIQILKAFSLSNSLDGVCLLIKNIFDKDYYVTTIEMDRKTGEIINATNNSFEFDGLSNPDTIVLFQIDIEGQGSIILDLFQRSGK